MNYKYNVSVLGIFRNESLIIKEWIEHYIAEGIEHFYLINNGSSDNFEKEIEPFKKIISLVNDPTREDKAQMKLYNKHFLKLIKDETKWIIVVDIDEYIYARNEFPTIKSYLDQVDDNILSIWVPWKNFGSNNKIEQPKNVVESFTTREPVIRAQVGRGKSISKTYCIETLHVHFAAYNKNISRDQLIYMCDYEGDFFIEDATKIKDLLICENNFPLQLNHYTLMSYDYFFKIKQARADGIFKSYEGKYGLSFFNGTNGISVCEDFELLDKKRNKSSD